MKRFLVMIVLLIGLLVVAQAVDASEDAVASGPTTEHDGFFEHTVRTTSYPWIEWSHQGEIDRKADAPRRVGERIRFQLRDRDYDTVWIEVDAFDWERIEMDRVPGRDRWQVELDLPTGRSRYVFVVADRDGTVRTRTDAANARRRRDPERGWVSEVRLDRDGRLIEIDRDRRSRRRHRDRDIGVDFDVFDRIVASYQRVDGLSLGVRPRLRTRDHFAPELDAEFTYGFSSERWSARLSLLQPLEEAGRIRIHLSAYDETATVDRTGVGGFENFVSTLLFREDNFDWYRREGLSFGLEADIHQHVLARVEIRSDQHASLERTVIAGWGGREDFLPNPAIDEGVMRSVFVRARVGSDLDHLWVEFETSDDDLLSTDFDFTQLTVQGRSRLRLGRDAWLDVRGRFGTTLDGELPRQRRYLAGGIGTVRGTTYQSLLVGGEPDLYGGEQLLLANAEFVVDEGDMGVALFVDAGQVWADRDTDVALDDLVSSIGIGLLSDAEDDGGLRLDLIRTLEGGGSFMAQFRLRRPF